MWFTRHYLTPTAKTSHAHVSATMIVVHTALEEFQLYLNNVTAQNFSALLPFVYFLGVRNPGPP